LLKYEIDSVFLDKYCKQFDLIGWYLVSAKTRENLADAVSFLITAILSFRKSSPKSKSRSFEDNTAIKTDQVLRVHRSNEVFETKAEYYSYHEQELPTRMTSTTTRTSPKTDGKCC
jgi:hypothetical protein